MDRQLVTITVGGGEYQWSDSLDCTVLAVDLAFTDLVVFIVVRIRTLTRTIIRVGVHFPIVVFIFRIATLN